MLVYRKNSNISAGLIEAHKHFLVELSTYRGSIPALLIFIYYCNNIDRIPKVSPRLIVGEDYIRNKIWVRLQEAYIRRAESLYLGACIWNFPVCYIKYGIFVIALGTGALKSKSQYTIQLK